MVLQTNKILTNCASLVPKNFCTGLAIPNAFPAITGDNLKFHLTMSQDKKESHEHGTPVLHLTVNGKKHEWPVQYITGAEIRKLGSISKEDEIYLKIKSPWKDEHITDDTSVDLARPGLEEFFSLENPKPITLIVNGREKHWPKNTISFEEVVRLAFDTYVENDTTVYTVTYKRGPKHNPEGSMVKGEFVYVKDKMIFNVTATNKS